jgi:PBP1b-binding outer membrane lipoprotein LpoB
MKKGSALRIFVALMAVALLAGCSGKTNAKTELEKAADALAKTEAEPTPATPASSEPAPPSPPTSSAPEEPIAPPATPARQMQQAMASYKSGELEDAVTRLQKLRAVTTLTPQQRMALQDSVAAVMTEIYGLAAKGDSRAIQAVKQYEQMQTTRQ